MVQSCRRSCTLTSLASRYLAPSAGWAHRYGLSDSLFLVAEDPITACSAAAELFFNLAFYNREFPEAVLLRGAITLGQVRPAPPLFPETASANLVGEAVVRAVMLEKAGTKGPRLLVSTEVANALEGERASWLLEPLGDAYELLWLLPPDPSATHPELVGAVAETAVGLFLRHGSEEHVADHYLGYLRLALRSLLRLRQDDAASAAIATANAGLARLTGLVAAQPLLLELEALSC